MAAFPLIVFHASVALAVANNLCHTNHEDASCLDDQAASFLQLSSHAKSADRRAVSIKTGNSKVSAIVPLNCSNFKKPLQVMGGDDGYSVKRLDVSTGEYLDFFDIPFTAVEGGYTTLNGCGVNPKDSIMYCAMFARGAYIVRIDETATVEFVARLPWYDLFNTGGFSMDGTFYLANMNSFFLVLQSIHKVVGVPASERNNGAIADYRKSKYVKPLGWKFSADVVIATADLGDGPQEYVFVLYGARLQVAKYNKKAKKFDGSWVIDVKPPRNDNIYGAGWNFQNRIFFSSNRGSGVYQVPFDGWTLDEATAPGFALQLDQIGKSAQAGHNDGMNCQNVPDPWTSKVAPFPCMQYPGLLQAMKRDDCYDVMNLNHTTGNYTMIYSLPFNMTSPPFYKMNAFAIGPVDVVGYASLVIDDWNESIYPTPPPFYLVRFDDEGIEFIAKVQAERGSPIAGAFDKEGNYYVISNPSLIQIPMAHEMQGFDSPTDPDLPFFDQDSDVVLLTSHETGQIADFIATDGDFDGKGKATWLVGANAYQQLLCIKIEDDGATPYTLTTNDPLNGMKDRQNFGAAWLFWGEIYVSSNDGMGVFKVPKYKIKIPADGPIKLTKVGNSDPIENNDGMNCPRTRSPFHKKGSKYKTQYGSIT